jgi:hypothetical protein
LERHSLDCDEFCHKWPQKLSVSVWPDIIPKELIIDTFDRFFMVAGKARPVQRPSGHKRAATQSSVLEKPAFGGLNGIICFVAPLARSSVSRGAMRLADEPVWHHQMGQ